MRASSSYCTVLKLYTPCCWWCVCIFVFLSRCRSIRLIMLLKEAPSARSTWTRAPPSWFSSSRPCSEPTLSGQKSSSWRVRLCHYAAHMERHYSPSSPPAHPPPAPPPPPPAALFTWPYWTSKLHQLSLCVDPFLAVFVSIQTDELKFSQINETSPWASSTVVINVIYLLIDSFD